MAYLFLCVVNYAEELSKVIRNVILLSKVAFLAKDIQRRAFRRQELIDEGEQVPAHRSSAVVPRERLTTFLYEENEEHSINDGESSAAASDMQSPFVIDPEKKDPRTGHLSDSQKSRVSKLLGDWEEPEKLIGVEVSSSFAPNYSSQMEVSLTFVYFFKGKRVACRNS